MKHRTFLLLLVLAAATLVGCGRKVEVIFRNETPRPFDISLVGPGDGHKSLGRLAPHGQRETKVRVDKDLLPAHYTWHAVGGWTRHSGTFPIGKRTPDEIVVRIPSGDIERRRHR